LELDFIGIIRSGLTAEDGEQVVGGHAGQAVQIEVDPGAIEFLGAGGIILCEQVVVVGDNDFQPAGSPISGIRGGRKVWIGWRGRDPVGQTVLEIVAGDIVYQASRRIQQVAGGEVG
jgi:hypothetical protein